MYLGILAILLLSMMVLAYYRGTVYARRLKSVGCAFRSIDLPNYYGLFTALWAGIPALLVLFLWVVFQSTIITDILVSGLPQDIQSLSASELDLVVNDITNLAEGNIVSQEVNPAIQAAADRYTHLKQIGQYAQAVVIFSITVLGMLLARYFISPLLRARYWVEHIFKWTLLACSTIAIFTTIGIVLSVLFEALRFFEMIPFTEFIFGLEWSPQMALREDQVGSSGAFGAIPLFAGTFLISLIAMLVAIPVGLMSAIYLSEYASIKLKAYAKPTLEILAGVPTVVYGFFAALTVAPFIRNSGSLIGLDVSSESALAAGLVMGIMIIPFVSSLSNDVINAVPQSMRDASYGVGATQSETIRNVIIPAALPGIVGGVLLAVSRAIGETMIVVMAAGLSANLTANPLESVTTVTVQIVTLLVGDQEFDSPKTLAAFALGLALFVVTLLLNIIALRIVRKYREQYE
ncbi:MAG: phosphate ABC transporter permease subunit PstC [Gammaproteobacteria bacterium]|nr:phosphate ABC transporter permease subunit PstC [Gammaproteobacteria bacterium]